MSISVNPHSLAYAVPAKALAGRLWADILLGVVDRFRWPLMAILLLGYFAAFNGQWQIEPDSALYLTLGRNIALGRGYTYHGLPHDLAYPGFPYALSLLFRLFDSFHALFAADVMMVGCGLITLALTYRLILLYSNRPTAVLITLSVGVARIFARYCFEIMTDMPFLMGVMAFLAGYEAVFNTGPDGKARGRWYDWALLAIGAGIAISTRPMMIGLVAVAVGVTLWRAFSGKLSRLWAIVASVVVVSGVFAFFLLDPRQANAIAHGPQSYERWAVHFYTHDPGARLYDVFQNLSTEELYKTLVRGVFGMPGGLMWVNIVFGIGVIVAGLAITRKRAVWGLWIAMTFLLLIVFMPLDRYLLQALPVLMMACWEGLYYLNRKIQRPWGNLLFLVVAVLLFAANLAQFITIIVYQHRTPFLDYYKEGHFRGYVATAGQIKKSASPDELILCPKKFARVLTFLSDRPVVEEGETNDLDIRQYHLWVVNDPGDAEFQRWLGSLNVKLEGAQIFSANRRDRIPQPPISLWRAVVKSPR